MENLTLIKPEKVQNIINKFCYTIGMIPTSYKISMTYEEQIIAIGNYLETTVEQLTDGDSLINDNGFEPEQSSKKAKISVIDISSEEWIIHPIDYEWVSTKYLTPETGYLMFDVVDDLMAPKYDIGDTVLAQFLDNKPIKSDGDYLLKLKDYDSWLFIHVYVKDNGYLVAPLNNNNSKSFLPRFYTKEEFIKNAFNVHKAVRVSKNI